MNFGIIDYKKITNGNIGGFGTVIKARSEKQAIKILKNKYPHSFIEIENIIKYKD